MLKNYLLITLRRILRDKLHTIINIVGMSIGLAAFILILLYVKKELSIDNFLQNKDKIYRLQADNLWNGTCAMPAPLSDLISEKIPEVDFVSRVSFWPMYSPLTIKTQNGFYNFYGLMYVDTTFLKIFKFEPAYGNVEYAFKELNSIVLTQKAAKNIFGTDNAVGKTISTINNEIFHVSLVLKDLPANSSFTFSALSPFLNLSEIKNNKKLLGMWGRYNYSIYIQLNNTISKTSVENKLNREYKNATQSDDTIKFSTVPLQNVYFSDYSNDGHLHGSFNNIIILISIGFFILIIAIINYVNLSTAKAALRAKEIGVRKATGGNNKQIVIQFLIESTLMILISMNFAFLLVNIFSGFLSSFFDYDFSSAYIDSSTKIIAIIVSIIILGIINGLYPAFYMTSFQPVKVLKGEISRGTKGEKLRKSLLVFQFFISIALIICTIIIIKQINYINKKELGFKKDNVITLRTPKKWTFEKREVFREKLKKNSLIDDAGFSMQIIGDVGMFQGMIFPEIHENKYFDFNGERVDYNYLKMMGFELKEGRYFTNSTNDVGALILNETAVKKYGLKNVLNTYAKSYDTVKRKIVGIVKDFHYKSLYNSIGPIYFECSKIQINTANIRINAKNSEQITQAKKHIETVWNEMTENLPLEYTFLDDNILNLYKKEHIFNSVFFIFSIISIFIATLGLYGLISFISVRRTKEIGIRKAHGASVFEILFMFSKDISRWVLISFLLASPIAWYFMSKWLENFAYKTEISWWIFILALVFTLFISLLTVCWQTYHAAKKNPVDALRYE